MSIDDRLLRLAEHLQATCLERGLTLATAESCTGGLVGHAITEISGSSAYFRGGVVSYSDDVKRDELDVPPELLERHGAVSAQVARAMAAGVRSRLHADVGLSVTGIAGPDGGSDSKPVGLTYLAVADADGCEVRRVVWNGSRSENKQASAEGVIELALARLGQPSGSAPPATGDAGRRRERAGQDPERAPDSEGLPDSEGRPSEPAAPPAAER